MAIETILLASFLSEFLFVFLNLTVLPNPKQIPRSARSHIYISLPPSRFRMFVFLIRVTAYFTGNILKFSMQTSLIFITITTYVNLFSKHSFYLRIFQPPFSHFNFFLNFFFFLSYLLKNTP